MGLVNMPEDDEQAMPDPATPDGGKAHEAAEGEPPEPMDESALSSQAVRAKMNLPPELKKAYERVLQAGIKLMFDPRTREQTMQMIASPGDPVQKIAQGVGSVMLALYQQSNGTMPQQIIIPVALELVMHVVEVVREAGAEVTDAQVGDAMEQTINFIAQKFGIDPNQIEQMASGKQPTSPAPEPQQPAGMVAQGA